MLRPEFQSPEAGAGERVAARITTRYIIDNCSVLAKVGGGELLRGLILAAIIDANVGHLQPAESRKVGAIDVVPPDEMRRPVSISALSRSLGVPFETVRRHVARMIEDGVCVRVDERGVIVPSAKIAEGKALTAELYDNLKLLLAGLDAAGFDLQAMARSAGNAVKAPE